MIILEYYTRINKIKQNIKQSPFFLVQPKGKYTTKQLIQGHGFNEILKRLHNYDQCKTLR